MIHTDSELLAAIKGNPVFDSSRILNIFLHTDDEANTLTSITLSLHILIFIILANCITQKSTTFIEH
jgi:hypothetical protein